MKQAYIYMIRCMDGSIYTGIARDLTKRLTQHYRQEKGCAKYTKAHPMKKLEMAFRVCEYSVAGKFEYRIKRLSKEQKEAMLQNPKRIEEYLELLTKDFMPTPLTEEEITKINLAIGVSCEES